MCKLTSAPGKVEAGLLNPGYSRSAWRHTKTQLKNNRTGRNGRACSLSTAAWVLHGGYTCTGYKAAVTPLSCGPASAGRELIFVLVWLCVHMCLWVFACVWRTEANTGHVHQLFSTLVSGRPTISRVTNLRQQSLRELGTW